MSEPRFDTYIKAVFARAEHEASDDGAATIEPQHVLLAVAAQDGTDAQRVLDAAGLGYAALKEALHREFAKSLSTAGVSLDAFDLPRATPDPKHHPQLGGWFKPAMERVTGASRGTKDLGSRHLLLGLLEPSVGTIPRALALSGVDRTALIERVRSVP